RGSAPNVSRANSLVGCVCHRLTSLTNRYSLEELRARLQRSRDPQPRSRRMNLPWNRSTEAVDDLPVGTGEHASHETLDIAVDPSYWPRALGLRVIIAISYFTLIPAGLLPMSTAWWLTSGGGLLVYSLVAFALYVRSPDKHWLHKTVSPYIDTLIVTLAM